MSSYCPPAWFFPVSLRQINELQCCIGKCQYIVELLTYLGMFMSEAETRRIYDRSRFLESRFRVIHTQQQYLGEGLYLQHQLDLLWLSLVANFMAPPTPA